MATQFKQAYQNQGDGMGWDQVAIELQDGTTIYVDINNGKGVVSYYTDKEGAVTY